ncbi:MAG: LuxR C-terminal-related transcriptional regulator [Candidatus Eremiobacteraeota bacterium]|nr:LuxR C-terminal-related transcriptional regulator [Candidatus Eremiobacteraeota bacterium]
MTGPLLGSARSAQLGVFTPIVRPRIIERIGFAAQHGVALILAPAGYGKSVALGHYLASVSDRHILYNVRVENSSLLGFARGLADALIDVAPGARSSVSGAFGKAGASKRPAEDLAAWMHAHLEAHSGILVIDDLHIVQHNTDITKFIVTLINLAGAGTRWIIASRSSLNLPVASWLAYGRMNLPVDELDLSFDFGEARDACGGMKTTIGDEELREMLALTEGWPTALIFALRLSMRLADLRSLKAMTREMTYRYLAEQVFYSLDERTREFLLYTSLMPSINVALLVAAGYDNGKAIIEDLRHYTAFLFVESSGVYRYHELFREFLSHQLSLLGKTAVVEMHARVGLAYEKYGDVPQALRLYAQAAVAKRTLKLLERFAFDLIEQGHADVVQAAANSIPGDERSSNPAMLGIAASFEGNAGRLERAEKLYRRAIALTTDPSMKIRIAVRLATIMTNQSRADAIALLEPFCATDDVSAAERCELNSLLACACAAIGQRTRAGECIAAALELVDEIESDDVRARVYQRAGFVAFYCRKPHEARKYSTEAARLALTRGLYRLAASAYSVLYSTEFDYGDDTQSMLQYAEQVADCAIKAGDLHRRQIALQQMLEIKTRLGDSESISSLEAQLAEPGMSDAFRFTDVVIPARALRATWDGRFSDANRLLSGILENYGSTIESKLRFAECALFFAVDGQRQAALRTLERSVATSSETKASSPTDERQLQTAVLFNALTNALSHRTAAAAKLLRSVGPLHDPSVIALQRAVLALSRFAQVGVLDRRFANDLIALHSVGYGGYARMLEAISMQAQMQRATLTVLTPSETSVLQALAEGQTSKEIALATSRSVNTVHVHVRAAIRKLRCHGRQEAIALARSAGLIA